MTQQINLYQPILRREQKVFSAVTMLQFLGALAIVMLAMFAFSRWQLAQLEAEHARLVTQERELIAQVTQLTNGHQEKPESRELRRQAEMAQREIVLKTRLLKLMESQPVHSAGFADAFAGLARQRVDGLWLTGVEIERSGESRDVFLRGRAARAELVPQFVQLLSREPAFAGLRFQHMRLAQPKDGSGDALAFELGTSVPEKETSAIEDLKAFYPLQQDLFEGAGANAPGRAAK